jgi:two-component system, cell cycle response regulator DivK
MVEGTRPTVLLIDSYRDNREMYCEFLAVNGFPTVAADTSDSGVHMASDADVIVTGINLRGSFDGLELLRRVRREQPDKPVIVLTALVGEKYRREAEQAGCDTFLLKPCAPGVLVDEIRRLFEDPRTV